MLTGVCACTIPFDYKLIIGTGPDLENSIAISLTVVFVLPGLRPATRGDGHTTTLDKIFSNNMMIALLFLGLIFTSIIHATLNDGGILMTKDVGEGLEDNDATTLATDAEGAYMFVDGTKYPTSIKLGVCGLALIWGSMVIPVVNWIRYNWFKYQIKVSSHVNQHILKGDVINGATAQKNETITRPAFVKDKSFNQFEMTLKDKSMNSVRIRHYSTGI